MNNEIGFLRLLDWPIVKNSSKSMYTCKLRSLLTYYYEQTLRYNTELSRKEKNQIVQNNLKTFLSNFRQITQDGTEITLGIGKMSSNEMDEEFGYAKNPNPGNSFFAGKSTRNKSNVKNDTKTIILRELNDAMPES